MTARRFALWVVAGVALLQSAWILVVPPFGGIDEFDHVYHAAAVAHGEWMPGPYAADGRGRLVTVPKDLAAAATRQCEARKYTGPDNCVGVASPRPGMVRVASAAATYNLPFYAAVGTAGKAVEGAASVYAMRVATGLICLLLIGAGAWCLGGIRRGRWIGIGVIVALCPVAVYSTIVVAPNGPEIAAGFAFWCALLALARPAPPALERRMILIAGVAAIVLGNLRELGPGFLIVSLGLCIAMAPARALALGRRHRWYLLAFAILIVVAIIEQIWWTHMAAATGGTVYHPDARPPWNWNFVVAWPLSTIAAFPYRGQAAPAFVYPVFGLALAVLWFAAVRQAYGRFRVGLVVLTVGVLVMPFLLTAVSYSRLGVIWQGRYGLPLEVGVPLLAAVLLGTWRPREFPWLTIAFAIAMTAIEAASLLHVREIEMLGLASRADPNWHTPSAALVVALTLAAGVSQYVVVRARDTELGGRGSLPSRVPR